MNSDTLTRREENGTVTREEKRFAFTPKCDIWENQNSVYLEVEMPGVTDQNVDVSLEDGILTILGRVEPLNLEGYSRVYAEYEDGNFERSFRISDEIDEEKISATMKHGLLRLELPKREAVKPRRISVTAA